MTEPNLMIIGAAKAGTSALHSYLKQHPDIFMSAQKELRYFMAGGKNPHFAGPGDEPINRGTPTDYESYCAHFSTANGARYIGESSPFYLCSETAAEDIHAALPDTKLICVLREPVSRAFSSYNYLKQSKRETLDQFRDALAAETDRTAQNWEYMWRYRSLGLYSAQLKRFYDHFPKENIYIGLYEELEQEPVAFVQNILAFLDLDPSFAPTVMGRANASGKPRSEVLHKILTTQNPVRKAAGKIVPTAYREQFLYFLTTKNLKRLGITDDIRQEMMAFYRPDIDALETLIDRDLSHWKQ